MVRLLEVDHYTEEKYQHYCRVILEKYSVFGLRRAIGSLGDEMSLLIKENFTKAREDRIIANDLNIKKGMRRNERTTTRTNPPAGGGPSSGY